MNIKKFYQDHKEAIVVVAVLIIAYMIFGGSSSTFSTSGSAKMIAATAEDAAYSSGGFAMEQALSRNIVPMPPVYDSDEAGFYPDEERKIRKDANINIEIEGEKYKQSLQEVKDIIGRNSGFFTDENEYKNLYNKKEYRTYSITLKVPVDNFDATVEQLKLVGDVKNYNVYSSDMTTQYMDTKSYLESYQKEKARIEQLLDKAEQIEDIIKVEERLNSIQRMIDSYQRQLTNINRVTEYSQISVIIQEKRPVSEAIYTMTGIRQLLRNIISSFDALFVFISNIVGWLIGLLVMYGAYRIFKKLRR